MTTGVNVPTNGAVDAVQNQSVSSPDGSKISYHSLASISPAHRGTTTEMDRSSINDQASPRTCSPSRQLTPLQDLGQPPQQSPRRPTPILQEIGMSPSRQLTPLQEPGPQLQQPLRQPTLTPPQETGPQQSPRQLTPRPPPKKPGNGRSGKKITWDERPPSRCGNTRDPSQDEDDEEEMEEVTEDMLNNLLDSPPFKEEDRLIAEIERPNWSRDEGDPFRISESRMKIFVSFARLLEGDIKNSAVKGRLRTWIRNGVDKSNDVWCQLNLEVPAVGETSGWIRWFLVYMCVCLCTNIADHRLELSKIVERWTAGCRVSSIISKLKTFAKGCGKKRHRRVIGDITVAASPQHGSSTPTKDRARLSPHGGPPTPTDVKAANSTTTRKQHPYLKPTSPISRHEYRSSGNESDAGSQCSSSSLRRGRKQGRLTGLEKLAMEELAMEAPAKRLRDTEAGRVRFQSPLHDPRTENNFFSTLTEERTPSPPEDICYFKYSGLVRDGKKFDKQKPLSAMSPNRVLSKVTKELVVDVLQL